MHASIGELGYIDWSSCTVKLMKFQAHSVGPATVGVHWPIQRIANWVLPMPLQARVASITLPLLMQPSMSMVKVSFLHE